MARRGTEEDTGPIGCDQVRHSSDRPAGGLSPQRKRQQGGVGPGVHAKEVVCEVRPFLVCSCLSKLANTTHVLDERLLTVPCH